jgi:hypothetical protein
MLLTVDLEVGFSDDPAATVYAEALGLDHETLPGTGHLTVRDGFGPLPQVLKWCLDATTRFTAPNQHAPLP